VTLKEKKERSFSRVLSEGVRALKKKDETTEEKVTSHHL